MPTIRLILWDAAQAAKSSRRLEDLGHTVVSEPFDGRADLRAMSASPPAAVVIDLSRMPSHGRDVGIALRISAATRSVPLLFVDGDREKVARVRKALPDAVYTSWEKIGPALERAIAQPSANPHVPSSMLAGYSGTPLPKKLGIRAGSVVVLAGAPDGFEQTLGELPDDAQLRRRNQGQRNLTIWFVRSRAELDRGIEGMAKQSAAGHLWIAWPKKSGSIVSDLSEACVRQTGLDAGIVDFKICAIDAAWSGLCFARRRNSPMG
jgi:hypothetical protein